VLAALVAAAIAPAPAAAADDLRPATPVSAARLERAGGALAPDRALAVRYDGAFDYEGHLERPHALKTYRSSRRITIAGPNRARQDWTTWEDGDTARTVESTLLLGDRVLRRDDASSPWVELSGRAAGEAAWMVWSAVPALISARGQERLGHGLQGGAVNDYRSRFVWPDPLGPVTLELDVVDLPFQMQVATNDPWRGSLLRDCRYFGITQQAGHTWPDSLATMGYPQGAAWRLRERRVAIEGSASLADLAPPDSVRPMPPARTDTVAVTSALAPHVWAVDLPDVETRSLVLEFTDHLMVLETSSDVPHGERLKAAIAGLSPKPVRRVAFSHHHPDYTGGLRPFIADTATVVCAQSNRAYVDEIAHWSFALDPDRLWKRRPGGLVPLVDTLTAGRWRHADAVNELVAIDIGEKSHHTDAYLVFWLPRAKLLFEGDLGWFDGGSGVRASSRSPGLLEAIDAAKLAPATLVQSWTPGPTPHTLAMREFRALVAARAGR
jgi:glyoxylase-like metal-dependent hydrolase (beta-lactamase superfamily II)